MREERGRVRKGNVRQGKVMAKKGHSYRVSYLRFVAEKLYDIFVASLGGGTDRGQVICWPGLRQQSEGFTVLLPCMPTSDALVQRVHYL